MAVVACSDSVVGTGPAAEAYDQVVVDYTGVSEATGKIFAGSKNFSFVVGDPDSLVRCPVHAVSCDVIEMHAASVDAATFL
jgi:hypothetical protein